jgi:AraC family transcriptional regulator of adaptative response / DNA-3-methyladenine glycosylase II
MNGLGVTPIAFARTRRVQLAKRLIDETQLSITQIAFASGFRSIRQFNGTFREIYQRSPREIRRDEKGQGVATGSFQLRLSFRPPLNWGSMLKFIEPRLLTGIEKSHVW